MIDTQKDELLSLTEAAKQCPAVDGKRPCASSIWRWMKQGCRGIRLEHVRVGRRVVTTRAALEEFFRASAAVPVPERASDVQVKTARTAKQRARDLEAAKQRLNAHGVRVGSAA